MTTSNKNWIFRTAMLTVALICAGMTAGLAAEGAPVKKPAILDGVKTICFYGDSLTDGSSYPDYVVNTLARCWPDAGFTIMNAAICGNTARDLLKRLQADVLARKPDLIVITIGTNDCNGKRPVEQYQADMETLVTTLEAAGVRVVLVRPSPFGNAEKEERFQAYLAAIDAVAAAHHLLTADAHAEFLRGAKDGREMLGADGIHHGKDGFAGMARAILDAFGLQGVPTDLTIRPWPGLLTAWETSAPVAMDGKYDPAVATGWRPYDAAALAAKQGWWNAPFPLRGAWMPFEDVNPKQAAYGRTYYDAPDAGDYELRVGGSPPQVVWINGKKVWESGRIHGYHPNTDFLTVRLEKGRNEIVALSNFMIFVGVSR